MKQARHASIDLVVQYFRSVLQENGEAAAAQRLEGIDVDSDYVADSVLSVIEGMKLSDNVAKERNSIVMHARKYHLPLVSSAA